MTIDVAPAPARAAVPHRLDTAASRARRGSRALFRISLPAHLTPTLVLIAVAVTWGVSFSVVDSATAALPPSDVVFWRFGIAGLVLCCLGRGASRLPAGLRLRGVALGVLLGMGFLLQTWALTETDAMMSGFLIGTLVVIAPILAWALFRVRPPASSWCGVAVATVGLAVMSMRGSGFARGEAATVLAAGIWALHLVLLARWGKPGHAVGLARVQTVTVTGMALLAAVGSGLMTGSTPLPALPRDGQTWLAIGFLAVPATAVAMIAVSWAQPRMTAARAAVALTLEPAASAVTAAMLGTELDTRMILGGAMLVGATLMVELGGLWAARKHNAADLIAATAQHGRRRPIPHAVTVLFQGVRGIAPSSRWWRGFLRRPRGRAVRGWPLGGGGGPWRRRRTGGAGP